MYKVCIVVAILFLCTPVITKAYTIESPRIIVHPDKHLVQIKWYQPYNRLIVVMKLTQSRQMQSMCSDDWGEYVRDGYGYKYCFDIYRQWANGELTIQDPKWQRGDMYFLLRYDYTSHNAPYGPFKP